VLVKNDVSIKLLSPQMALAAQIVDGVFADFDAVCTITAGEDGKHKHNSLHYKGLALDFRTRHVPPGLRPALAEAVRLALGPQFDVVLHSTHLHVEFDPK
jgi:hypothetical protein